VVGPSLSDDEQRTANLRLQVGFVVLVSVSGGLVSLQAGGSPSQVGVGLLVGLVVGLLLRYALLWVSRDFRSR
jgi:hypothetical protein